MSLTDRDWTLFALEAEYDDYNMHRIVPAHNALRAEVEKLERNAQNVAEARRCMKDATDVSKLNREGWEHALAEVEGLRGALRPFANYACEPPCGCHNCKARAALEGKVVDPATIEANPLILGQGATKNNTQSKLLEGQHDD